ncbi:MAG: hypothetical protein NTZ09_03705 [Candidatus Hydrogenedentes bacterium]|nr:hypothetical protein [Candidatus Hydrogenedentota bacterium]
MFPPFVPLDPDVIHSQLPPEVTLAVQFMVPVPAFQTLNDVLPEDDATSRCEGAAESTGWGGVGCGDVGQPTSSRAIAVIAVNDAVRTSLNVAIAVSSAGCFPTHPCVVQGCYAEELYATM